MHPLKFIYKASFRFYVAQNFASGADGGLSAGSANAAGMCQLIKGL